MRQECMTILIYVLAVVGCNVLFAVLEPWHVFGQVLPPGSLLAGAVFVARDYAHQRYPRAVLLAMAIAAALSYLLASPAIAVASAVAFSVAELVDYAVYRWAGGSLRRRIVLSSLVAVPIDTVLFLGWIGALSWGAAFVMSVVKLAAVAVCLTRSRR